MTLLWPQSVTLHLARGGWGGFKWDLVSLQRKHDCDTAVTHCAKETLVVPLRFKRDLKLHLLTSCLSFKVVPLPPSCHNWAAFSMHLIFASCCRAEVFLCCPLNWFGADHSPVQDKRWANWKSSCVLWFSLWTEEYWISDSLIPWNPYFHLSGDLEINDMLPHQPCKQPTQHSHSWPAVVEGLVHIILLASSETLIAGPTPDAQSLALVSAFLPLLTVLLYKATPPPPPKKKRLTASMQSEVRWLHWSYKGRCACDYKGRSISSIIIISKPRPPIISTGLLTFSCERMLCMKCFIFNRCIFCC